MRVVAKQEGIAVLGKSLSSLPVFGAQCDVSLVAMPVRICSGNHCAVDLPSGTTYRVVRAVLKAACGFFLRGAGYEDGKLQ